DYTDNQIRKLIVRRCGITNNSAHGRLIVIFHAPAQGESHQFFREGMGKILRSRQQSRFEAIDTTESAAVRQATSRVDRLAFLQFAPAADRIKILERKTSGIHAIMASS